MNRRQQIVGIGSRSVGRRYVNGQRADIGYLSGLRILAEHRCKGLLARGFAYLRQTARGRPHATLRDHDCGGQSSGARTLSWAGVPACQPIILLAGTTRRPSDCAARGTLARVRARA